MAVRKASFNPYNFNVVLLRLSGYWQVWGRWRPVYIAYQSIMILGYLLMLLSGILIVFGGEQLTALNDILVVSCGIVIIVFKAAFLIPNAAKVQQLQADFNQYLHIPHIIQQEENRLAIQKTFKRNQKLTIFTTLAMLLTSTLWSLFPQIDKEIGLRIPFWWPSHQIDLQYFEIIYGYQVVLLYSASLCLAGTDIMFWAFLIQVTTHYDILINNINEMSSRKLHIQQFVAHHVAIKSAVKRMEEIYKGPVLVQIIIGTFIICVSGFEVFVLNSEFNGHIPSRVLYMVLALYDIFMYCFYADDIINMGEKVGYAVYKMRWECFSWKDKHAVVMMIAQSQRSPHISIGSFAPLNLTAYLSMLKTAYSIFSLLHQVVTN